MSTPLKRQMNAALESIPPRAEIRRRIAENLQERHMLRQLLRLAESQEVFGSTRAETDAVPGLNGPQ
jgi:hypothetical protein